MANSKASPDLKALPTSSSLARTLPSDAVLDALKMILLGALLNEVLTTITRLIEAHSEGMACSIFLLAEDGLHLRYGAAPNLPDAHRAATDGVCIGPNVGSCGTAAYLRQPVFVSDIAIIVLTQSLINAAIYFTIGFVAGLLPKSEGPRAVSAVPPSSHKSCQLTKPDI